MNDKSRSLSFLLVLLYWPRGCASTSGQSFRDALDKVDQQVDELTSRVVSLTNQFDATLAGTEIAHLNVDRLTRSLDKLEGNTVL